MPGFDDELSATIALAKASLERREAAMRAAEAAEREQAQKISDQFAQIKSRAMHFKHNYLEPLFKKVQKGVSEAGFHFVSNYINDEDQYRGKVGNTLECGEFCFVEAAIEFNLKKSIARVEAQTSKGSCYSKWQDFDEASSLPWFETNVAQAIGKLLESGEVPLANIVRFKN
ncbi:MAG: hypothetical protein L0211_11750 [Planctomycetaceae bacterium]|nr:hypothetical protein [Planctomycetaceae bacterium]